MPDEYETSYYFTDGAVKIKGANLWVYENGQYVDYGNDHCILLEKQLEELVKWLRGEENELVTPEYGRDVIKVLEQVV